MIDKAHLEKSLAGTGLQQYLDGFIKAIDHTLTTQKHGDGAQWQHTISLLPDISPSEILLNKSIIQIGQKNDADIKIRRKLKDLLMIFQPWRKGPFEVFNILINTEWRSDLKWDRLISKIKPLSNKRILDVGCGNGYHCLRSLGEGAKVAIGIEPYLLYNAQFQSLKKYIPNLPVHILPLTLEQLKFTIQTFDVTFSMGVLYHVKSPLSHLELLKSTLRSGGQLILETLIVDGSTDTVLMPAGRYAKMRNVWFIPSPGQLEIWLKRCGYKNIQLLDISRTTVKEQRSTDWMTFESLSDFLTDDCQKTVEGYPAPLRAIFSAEKI